MTMSNEKENLYASIEDIEEDKDTEEDEVVLPEWMEIFLQSFNSYVEHVLKAI